MRLVLDTNIVIDLLHFADRRAQPLQAAINGGQALCFTDTPCLDELRRVTGYPEFGLDPAARDSLLRAYRRFVTVCDASADEDYALPQCRDKDDQKFLLLAARCRADVLVTRDKLLLELARQRHPTPPCAILTAAAAGALLAFG
jgi:putative PIN family toxin of toxin-antitoxin system